MSNGTVPRRSVFSGLLIILIGLLFLLHNFAPSLGIGRLLERYWPFLLIFWGLAKLYDHFAAQRTGGTKPPILTGGEVALLVLVFAVSAGIVVIDRVKWPTDFPNLFEEKTTSTEELPALPVKPGAKISISTDYGNISIHTGESNDIRVIATKTVSASNESEGQRRAQQIKVDVIPVSNGYNVHPDVGSSSAQVDLEINVPKQVTIAASTDKGDISASDLGGPVAATAKHGNVEIHDVGGDIDARMQHGDARITGIQGNVHLTGEGSEVELGDIQGDATIEGEFYGPIRVRNVTKTVHFASSRTDLTIVQLAGQMEMDSGQLQISDASGGVTLVTKNKDVVMENVGGRIHIENRHGDIRVQFRQPPHEEINISDDSGEITLTMPASSNFEIVATSRSGEIQNDFQDPSVKSVQNNENSQLQGKVGPRGPQIRLSTSYGTIHIVKGP